MSETEKKTNITGIRSRMKLNTVLTAPDGSGATITIKENLGKGTSCYVYGAMLQNPGDIPHPVLLKEFCPDPEVVTYHPHRSKGHFMVSRNEYSAEMKKLRAKFLESYELQSQLDREKELEGWVVKPRAHYEIEEESGLGMMDVTAWILLDDNYSHSLQHHLDVQKQSGKPTELREYLHIMDRLCEALQRLHEYGKVLYADIEPKNILWERGNMRLFDFDAVLPLDKKKLKSLQSGDLRSSRGEEVQCDEIRKLIRMPNPGAKSALFVTPYVDVYNTVLMLFHLLTGKEITVVKDRMNMKQYMDLLKEGGMEDEKYRRAIAEIFVRAFMGRNEKAGNLKRYKTMADLQKDIVSLKEQVEKDIDARIQANWINVTAKMMDENPLYPFVVENTCGMYMSQGTDTMENLNHAHIDRKEVHVGLIGVHGITEAIFENILSAAQMLDTMIHIHWASENPYQLIDQWYAKNPVLLQTMKIEVDGQEIGEYQGVKTNLSDQSSYVYTDKVFAVIHLETLQKEQLPFNDSKVRWLVIANAKQEDNVKYLELLQEELKDTKDIYFIGYGGSVPKHIRMGKRVKVQGFNVRADRREQKNFDDRISMRGLAVHTMYTLQYSDREDQIKEKYKADPYNVKSSVRCALSIPYKLYSAGIEDNEQAAHKYHEYVVSATDRTLFNKLVYLEHRRWTIYTILDGYQCPDDETFKSYAYVGMNDHRQRTGRKLHIAMYGSSPAPNRQLSDLTKKQWPETMEEYLAMPLSAYDRLDQASMRMHVILCDKVKQIGTKGYLAHIGNIEDVFRKDGDLRKNCNADQDLKELSIFTENVCSRATGYERPLKKKISEIRNKLEGMKETTAEHGAERVMGYLQNLENDLRFIFERNKYTDYKLLDYTIIENLPLIMSDGIKTIYKPMTGNQFYDCYSTLVTRCSKLVLVGNDINGEAEQLQNLLVSFGIHAEVSAVKDMEHVNLQGKGKYVDVTGNDPLTVAAIMMDHRRSVREAGLFAYDSAVRQYRSIRNAEEISFFMNRPHLNVEESIRMNSGSVKIDCEAGLDRMNEQYAALMKVAMKYPSHWDLFCKQLYSECRKVRMFYLGIQLSRSEKTIKGDASEKTTAFMLKVIGAEQVLQKMKEENLISDYTLPAGEGVIEVKTNSFSEADCADLLTWMAAKANTRHSHMLSFERAKGRNGIIVYDETCHFRLTLEERDAFTGMGKKQVSKSEFVRNIMADIYAAGKKVPLAVNCQSEVCRKSEDGRTFTIEFIAADQAMPEIFKMSGSILETYTYHEVRKYADPDDIRMNVQVYWNKADGEETAINNELDVVFTKDGNTYFISCKMTDISTAHLNEIAYLSRQFGVNGAPILVTSKHVSTEAYALGTRAESMGVYVIDQGMLMKLGEYIRNIISGKKDWKTLS